TNWLRGGTQEERLGRFKLPPLIREIDRRDALISIAKLAVATGAPLIIVLDQIEAVSGIGDPTLLGKVIASAVQLVEGGISGTGIIISALSDTFDSLKNGYLGGGFVSRIENGVTPVALAVPSPEDIRQIVDRRTQYLLECAGTPSTDAALQTIAPDWLL